MNLEIDTNTIDLLVGSMQKAMSNAKANKRQSSSKTYMKGSWDKWDCIITDIYNNMDNSGYKLGIYDARIFKVLVIYEKESGILFSVMRDSNYKQVLKGKKKVTHYIYSMLSTSKNLANIGEQLKINGCEAILAPNEKEILEWKKSNILAEIDITEKDINAYVTIVFKEKGFVLEKIKAYLTNIHLQVIDSKDWSEYIRPDIDDYKVEEVVEEIDVPIHIKVKLDDNSSDNDDIQDEQHIDVAIKTIKKTTSE